MGDRGIVVCVSNESENPDICAAGIYVHWDGDRIPRFLKSALEQERLRAGDMEYSAARVCGVFHENIPDDMSLGLLPAPKDLSTELLEKYSHGNAGVVLLNCSSPQSIRCVGGYLEDKYSEWTPLEDVEV